MSGQVNIMSTLVESIQSMFTPPLFGSLAAKTGISEGKIRTGMSASTTAIMDGLVGKARDSRAMGDVANLIDHTPDFDDPMRAFDEDGPMAKAGNKLLGFATHDAPGMIKRLGATLGLGTGITTSLISAAAGLIMGAFRKLSKARGGIDAASLSSSLLEESSALRAGIPGVATSTARITERVETQPVERKRTSPLWWLAALVPLALLALWLFDRGRTPERTAVNVPTVTPPAVVEPMVPTPEVKPEPTPPPVTALPEPAPMPEPATKLDLPADSAEAALLSNAQTPTTDKWVVLDDVKFETGSAEIPTEAQEQITNVAAILEENQDIKIEIGGFTSGTGSTELNQTLSQTRADNVRQALIDQGVDPARVQANGFGEEDKVIDTDAEEQANRRVAARVIGEKDEG